MGWLIAGQCILIIGFIVIGVLAWATWSAQITKKNLQIVGLELQLIEVAQLGYDYVRIVFSAEWASENQMYLKDMHLFQDVLGMERTSEDNLLDMAMIAELIASERGIVDQDD